MFLERFLFVNNSTAGQENCKADAHTPSRLRHPAGAAFRASLLPAPFLFVQGFSLQDSTSSPPSSGPGSCLSETPVSRLVELIFLLCFQEPRKPVPGGFPWGPAPGQTHTAYSHCAATSTPCLARYRRSTPLPAGVSRWRKSGVYRPEQPSIERP